MFTLLFVLTLLLLPSLHVSLTCYLGTTATATSNCTVTAAYGQDSCVGFLFQTPLVPGNGTYVYTCGNCSLYQSFAATPGGFASNVTCCASGDLCQPVAPAPPLGSCEELVSQTNCTARADCYWCGAGLFGVGLCQSFVGFTFPGSGVPQLPAFALPLVVPPPVCSEVAFQQFQPAYTVNKLTLAYLEAFGFPAIISNMTIAVGISLEVLSRVANTRILNDTEAFCSVDEELRNWCGINTSQPFAYCIISETWPQYDVWGWIENTTFTSPSSSLTPIYPSFCACPIAGRAYYIPTGGQCGVESTLLAFYIILIVAHAIVFCIVFWDFGVFVLFMYKRKKRFTIGSAFFVKILMLAYFLVAIPSLVIQAVPPRGRNAMFITQGILNILVYAAFSQAVMCFMQILIGIKFFGAAQYGTALRLFRWLFFLASGFFSLTAIAILSALSYYTQQLADFNVQNLTQLSTLANDIVAPLARTLVLLLMIKLGVTLIVVGVLLGAVGVVLFQLKNLHGTGDMIARFIGLVFALICGIPDLAMLIMVCYFVGWISFGPNPSPWDSTYHTTIANAWFTWALYACQLLWISTIAYSMRTVVTNDWLVGRFRRMLNAVTSRTGGGSELSDGSGQSGTSDTSTAQEMTFNDDD